MLALQPFALFRGMGVPLATGPLINAVMFSGYGFAKRWLTTSKQQDTPWFDGPADGAARADAPAPGTRSPPQAVSHSVLTVADHGVIALDDDIDDSGLQLWQLAVAGAYSGFLYSFIVGPVELVKIQLQVQAADKRTAASMINGVATRHYKGPVDFALDATRKHGWRAMFQGLPPTVIVETLACSSQFVSYEVCVCVCVWQNQNSDVDAWWLAAGLPLATSC